MTGIRNNILLSRRRGTTKRNHPNWSKMHFVLIEQKKFRKITAKVNESTPRRMQYVIISIIYTERNTPVLDYLLILGMSGIYAAENYL